MNLNFSYKFPINGGNLSGKLTNFVEKIWTGFPIKQEDWSKDYEKEFYKLYGNPHSPEGICPYQKIHTIRKDKSERWKVGNKIHFTIGARTKKHFQFAPVISVKSIQSIQIKPEKRHVVYQGTKVIDSPVFIDERPLKAKEIKELALNDGFDSVDDLFEWFDEDFQGKLIHWTCKKY